MRKSLLTAAFAATVALSSAAAGHAATFDFGLLADGNEGTWDSRATNASIAGGAFDGALNTFTVDGISVVATASNAGTTATSFAYLDSKSGGKLAGLGVCSSTITAAFQCGTASDDNTGLAGDVSTGAFESVTLSFNKDVSITDLLLRDRDHNVLRAGFIGINGLTFNIASSLLSDLGVSNVFTFSRIANGVDFYVNTAVVAPVPLPMTLPLALAAIGALGMVGRRRAANA